MATKSITLLEDINLLVQEGIYQDRETLLQDAMRALLRSKPELRSQLAVALYKRRKVTLARASEIAGVDQESFKELLREAGISYRIEPIGESLETEVEHLLRFQNGGNSLMLIIDSDILSMFAKAGALDVLVLFFGREQIGMTPAIDEIFRENTTNHLQE